MLKILSCSCLKIGQIRKWKWPNHGVEDATFFHVHGPDSKPEQILSHNLFTQNVHDFTGLKQLDLSDNKFSCLIPNRLSLLGLK